LNIVCTQAIYDGVRFLRNILCVLAALAWLPMTAHCRLESIPGLEFLACLTESNCHGQQGSNRGDAGCCSAEKSQYTTEQLRVTLPSPDWLPISSAPLLDLANVLPAEVSIGILTAGPPKLTVSWQFSSRTALLARAPSLAS
jgi:hypothetical protein